MDDSLRKVIGIILMCTIILLPTGIALLRDRENKIMIFFINTFGLLLMGLGWFIAFFMALKARNQPIVVVNNSKSE